MTLHMKHGDRMSDGGQERMLEAQKGDFIFSLKEIDKGSFHKSICLVYEYLHC